MSDLSKYSDDELVDLWFSNKFLAEDSSELIDKVLKIQFTRLTDQELNRQLKEVGIEF